MKNLDLKSIKADYDLNGVTVIRNIIADHWLKDMRLAVDSILKSPGDASIEYTPSTNKGRYYGDFFLWMRNKTFKNFAFNSNLPELAGKIMGSKNVNFFYDQLLVKEPKTSESTPWHHDLPYWPISGKMIISFWIGFDKVTKNTGAVEYIKGSHKWNKLYSPASFGKNSGYNEIYKKMGLDLVPDIDNNRESYDILSWNLEPGDVTIHHPLVIHGSPGNFSTHIRRRGLALRYIGEDVTWDDRPGTFINNENLRKILPPLSFKKGDSLNSKIFPKIWSC